MDTCVLTDDIIAALARGRPSSLLMAMRQRMVRGFVSDAVWAEVPRVLEDRKREGGRFDLEAAFRRWWRFYIPQIDVVDTDHLPADERVRILASRDASDIGSLALLLTKDSDLLASGLAHEDWAKVRTALGKVGPAEKSAAEKISGCRHCCI
jgi:hypothetical protein